jgi:NAD(P)-dependent dehydrogenase (short-subunit alcohol dehydrogenase family)
MVTGANRGIGRACVVELRRGGFEILAGVRTDAQGRELSAEMGPGVTPLVLDLTSGEQITAAGALVERLVGERGLAGLVNNAGIVVAGPLEFLPAQALREQLEVNVVGLLSLTQALLPALRRARGRIVNISSVNGRVASPFSGAYAASKFALEALSDALRRELDGAVGVVIIQPGAFRTDIWATSRDRAARLAADYPESARRHYGRVLARLADFSAPHRAGNPAAVARVVGRALTSRRPRARYVVGTDARLGVWLAALLPTGWFDALIRARRRAMSRARRT